MQTAPLLALAPWLTPAMAVAGAGVSRATRTLMGTRVDIAVDGLAAPRAEAAMAAAWADMTRLANMMSRYRPGNLVHAMHLLAGLQAVPVPPAMVRVLAAGQALAVRSGGAFDMTVGGLTGWRFDRGEAVVPAAGEIARELPLVDYRDLIVDPGRQTAFLRRRGMRLDLGGIAKLPVLEAGMAALAQHGAASALINGGGDVLVSGRPRGQGWRVAVRDPLAPAELLGVLRLHGDAVVAASGDYERAFTLNGRRYHHILDPRTGMPGTRMRGVVLVAREAGAVNGLGAAMMVAGPAAARRWLAGMPGVDALLVDADGARWMSPGMRARLAGG